MRAAILGYNLVWLCMVAMPARADDDYPTSATVDYVLGCMKANGETRDALERCSCSFDVLASILPYERYVAAETTKRMALVSGERGSLFRGSAATNSIMRDLRRAQAEAELRCF